MRGSGDRPVFSGATTPTHLLQHRETNTRGNFRRLWHTRLKKDWLFLRPGRRQHRRQSTNSLPAAFRVSLVLVFGAPVDPRGSVIFGGVWLSDAYTPMPAERVLVFGGGSLVVTWSLSLVLPELSPALNLLNLEVDGDFFTRFFASNSRFSPTTSHRPRCGIATLFSPTVFNLPFAFKTGFLFHFFTSYGT